MGIPNLESVLREHNLFKELCNKADDVKILQGVLEIAKEVQPDHFIAGSLATEPFFTVTPVTAVSLSQKTTLAVFYLGTGFTAAYKGLVHSGILATVMDESCARAALTHYEALRLKAIKDGSQNADVSIPNGAVTTRLKLDYLAPVKTETCVIVKTEAYQSGSTERKADATGKLWNIGTDGEDVLAVVAESRFVRPKL